jgi:hypothetical protein
MGLPPVRPAGCTAILVVRGTAVCGRDDADVLGASPLTVAWRDRRPRASGAVDFADRAGMLLARGCSGPDASGEFFRILARIPAAFLVPTIETTIRSH